jgi:hypothetical protein
LQISSSAQIRANAIIEKVEKRAESDRWVYRDEIRDNTLHHRHKESHSKVMSRTAIRETVTLRLDAQTSEVKSYSSDYDQRGGYAFAGSFSEREKMTMVSRDGVKQYTLMTHKRDLTNAIGTTEKVTVVPGQPPILEVKEHRSMQLVRLIRSHPNLRSLTMQVAGAIVGGGLAAGLLCLAPSLGSVANAPSLVAAAPALAAVAAKVASGASAIASGPLGGVLIAQSALLTSSISGCASWFLPWSDSTPLDQKAAPLAHGLHGATSLMSLVLFSSAPPGDEEIRTAGVQRIDRPRRMCLSTTSCAGVGDWRQFRPCAHRVDRRPLEDRSRARFGGPPRPLPPSVPSWCRPI